MWWSRGERAWGSAVSVSVSVGQDLGHAPASWAGRVAVVVSVGHDLGHAPAGWAGRVAVVESVSDCGSGSGGCTLDA